MEDFNPSDIKDTTFGLKLIYFHNANLKIFFSGTIFYLRKTIANYRKIMMPIIENLNNS